jgi:microcystin degradation protein MlrC
MIFTAALGTETNTFSPIPTGLAAFKQDLLIEANASRVSSHWFVGPLRVWREMAEADGLAVTEGLAAFAQPAGLTTKATWEHLRNRLLDDLRAAGPVDCVLLNLHGAMAASGQADCSGELLAATREIVGPNAIIGAELDLHCHLTPWMSEAADILVAYKEYPHTDVDDRASELYRLAMSAVHGEIHPTMAVADCHMLGVWRTDGRHVRDFVDRMKLLESKENVLSVSFVHGFPWSNVPEVGAKILVVTDGNRDMAEHLAADLASEIWQARDLWGVDLLTIPQAVEMALVPQSGITVLADVSDNAGAGAASDSTFLLEALLQAGAVRTLTGSIWDPVSVEICFAAEQGSWLNLRIGGKVGAMSGRPLDVNAKVIALKRDVSQTFGNGKQAMGDSALIEVDGVHIMLNSLRTQMFHPDAFVALGCDLTLYDTIVVKSAQHFAAGFAPVAARIAYVAAPGTASPDLSTLVLPDVNRALWPAVEQPHSVEPA